MITQDLKTPKRFDNGPIIDLQDRTSDSDRKLRFMATILAVSDLECLGNMAPNGEALRDGMCCIFEGIADEYKKSVEQLRLEYDRSPEAIINAADITYMRIQNGFSGESIEQALSHINDGITRLDSVIEVFGDEYPEAQNLRASLLDQKKRLSKSSPVAGQKMKQTG